MATRQDFQDLIERQKAFNPDDAARSAAQAGFDQITPVLQQSLRSLRGSQVGRGRLTSGFGFDDEDRLFESFQNRLSSDISRNSVQLAGLGMQGLGQEGEMISGDLNRQLLQEQLKRRKRGGMFGGIGSLLGGAAGAMIGGPAGATIGAGMGGLFGQGIGEFV